jgi:tight adherence protein B
MTDGLLVLLLALTATVFVHTWTGRSERRLQRLRRRTPRRAKLPRARALLRRRLRWRARDGDGRREVADLVGRLAALSRAGVPSSRAWQVLAAPGGPGAGIARVTSDMVSSGGSTADGLRLAVGAWAPANGPPGAMAAVGWLALATDVVERSGAPSAAVYDGMAAGILAELARLDEQEVALAGARTTATLLAGLPLVGAGLGFLMGANVVAVLVGTPIGRLCLVVGVTAWVVGRRWTRRLVASAATATE